MSNILSLSYGKDSMACLGAIEQLEWPLDRIIHAEVWATDTIPADLPPMVEFKAKADTIIKERWGIEVEHIKGKYTYEQIFYRVRRNSKIGNNGKVYGFPTVSCPWCTGELKRDTVRKAQQGAECVYLGIAFDEPKRYHNLIGNQKSPLVSAGWTEADCRNWCEKNDLLSPIYTTAARGGCWFCHNQSIGQLRLLRHNYPKYWKLMLKWDNDSPVSFMPNGHTVHDLEHRFQLEDEGLIYPDEPFKWDMLNQELNLRWF